MAVITCLVMAGAAEAAPPGVQSAPSKLGSVRQQLLRQRNFLPLKGHTSPSAAAAPARRHSSTDTRLFSARSAKGAPNSWAEAMRSKPSDDSDHNCDLQTINWDKTTCKDIESMAHCLHATCFDWQRSFGELLCNLNFGGCLDSESGISRLEDLLLGALGVTPAQAPDFIDDLLYLNCNVESGTDLPLSDAPANCDLFFRAVDGLLKRRRDFDYGIMRPAWDLYVTMKCKPCAADLDGVDPGEYCTKSEPPKVVLECECHEPGRPFACFNKAGNTCCANASECHSDDQDRKPWCTPKNVPASTTADIQLE